MAIYAIGAHYNKDVSNLFIEQNIAGLGWDEIDAPDLYQFISSLKTGDIIYIKSFSPSSPDIIVKGIGIILDGKLTDRKDLITIGRNVHWCVKDSFRIPKVKEKNNVRNNTLYEEYHPDIQAHILKKLIKSMTC